jgi:virulence factor Mce-like protein
MHAMRSLLAFLGELARPSRTARAIPLGRLAIASLFAFVVLFIAFMLRSMGVQLPFVSHPYVIHAEFVDADGLDPSNGPPVSVAGVPEGQVTAARLDGHLARVTISLSGSARGRVFADASVRVRPFNGANFLEVDILPGHRAAGPLPAGATIDATRTSIPVATDQVLGVLDADTRAYLQLLTEQAAIALHGGGGPLAQALVQLAPLSGEARQIGGMLATRHRLIAQLVGEASSLFTTLGRRHAELAATLTAGTRLLSVTGSRSRELAQAMRELPGVLTQTQATSAAINGLAPELEQALARLAPAAGAFASGLRATRTAIPSLQRFVGATGSLARDTLQPSRELRSFAANLSNGVGPAISSYRDLDALLQTIVDHGAPIAHFSDAISGVFSTQDAYGPLGRVRFLGIAPPSAEDLGLPASAARAAPGSHSQLQLMLAAALDHLCRGSQPLACVIAAATPGLPRALVPLGAVRGALGSRP